MNRDYCLGIQQAMNLTLYKISYWNSAHGDWPLYPFAMEETVRDNEVNFTDNGCRYLLICMMLEGDLLYRDGMGSEYHLEQGKMLIVPQGSQFSFTSTETQHYHRYALELKGVMLPRVQQMLNLSSCRLFVPEQFKQIKKKYETIRALLDEEAEENVPQLIGLAWEVVTMLARSIREENPQEKILARARGLLERNLQSSYTVRTLAQELGISHSLLDRMFGKAMGLSPQQYRVQYRYRQAQYMLKHTNFSLKQIAARLGFANQLYFSNEFKKNSGVSPKAFREGVNYMQWKGKK